MTAPAAVTVNCRRAVVVTRIPPRHATVVTVSLHAAPGDNDRGTADKNSRTLANAAPFGAGQLTVESPANRTRAVAVSTVAEKRTGCAPLLDVTDPVTSNPLAVHRDSNRTTAALEIVSGRAVVSPTTMTVPVDVI
jgi:hypothetical protein